MTSGDTDLAARFPGVSFGQTVQATGLRNLSIGPGTVVGDDCWLNVVTRDEEVRLVIGATVLIGRQGMLSTAVRLEIGSHCVLAPRVYVSDVDHAFERLDLPIIEQGVVAHGPVTVEENCWLGVNVVVTGSLTVGRGSVVAANSVVLDDVPPFSVVAGTPARVVRMYDPAAGRWRRVGGAEDRAEIDAARAAVGLPDRDTYRRTLGTAARVHRLDPVLAGAGRHLP